MQEFHAKNLLQFVNAQDLKSFGLIPELLGRLPVITYLNPLDKITLRNILTEPRNSLIKQYKNYLSWKVLTQVIEEEVYEFMVEKPLNINSCLRP